MGDFELSTFALLGTMNLLALLAAVVPTVSAASWTATPFTPPSIPLAVRSPYLSAWLPQGSGTALNGAWPTFWTGSVSMFHNELILDTHDLQILGWAGFVKVDGTAYTFLGLPSVTGSTNAVQKSFSVRVASSYLSPVLTNVLYSSRLPNQSLY